MRDRHCRLAVPEPKHREAGIAQRIRIGQDRPEDRLHVCRRTTDDTQDLFCGRLLVQRSPQILIARLQLLEQPYVFDCDHGLISESLEECDLLVSEWPDLASP